MENIFKHFCNIVKYLTSVLRSYGVVLENSFDLLYKKSIQNKFTYVMSAENSHTP